MSYANSYNRPKATPPVFRGDSFNAMYLVDYKLKANQKRDDLRGYSKSVGKPECIDPYRNLQGFVSRILKAGYLDKSDFIQFRTNTFNPSESEVLVEITEFGYELHGAARLNFELQNRLEEFFLLRANGGDTKEVLEKYRQIPKVKEKDLFSFDQVFRNEEELVNHCKRLINEFRFPRLRVEGFYKTYRLKFANALDNPAGKEVANSIAEELAKNFRVNRNK